MNIFSHPQFYIGGNYSLVGYNLTKSAQVNGGPNYFGPFLPVTAYQGYTSNTDIVDATGNPYDLYQVSPIITATLPDGSTVSGPLPPSRPFFATQPLYDMSISLLLDTMRNGWVSDPGIPMTESTSATETSGGNVMPFISDPTSNRFYLAFLQNDNPVKIIPESVKVYLGTSQADAVGLVPYQDFYPSETGGYIDFASIPPTTDYCRVEYTQVRITNDQLRSVLTNAVSSLSLYGINGYEVQTSNNLYYLVTPLMNRDIGDIVCQIGFRNLLNSQFIAQLEGAESWKDGSVEWSADPGRALQAAAGRATDIESDIRHRANNYIYNTRQYIARGEFESFFDVSGTLPVYTLIVAGANFAGAMGFWLVLALILGTLGIGHVLGGEV